MRPFSAGGNGVVVSGVCAAWCPPTLLFCAVRASGVAESEKSTKARARHARFPFLRLRREWDRSVCSTSKAKSRALARAATTTTTPSQHCAEAMVCQVSGVGERYGLLFLIRAQSSCSIAQRTRSSWHRWLGAKPLLRLSFFRDNGSASPAFYWTVGFPKNATKTLRRAAPRQQ